MDQTIKLDAKKRDGSFCEEKIYPLRRGERNNVTLTVAVRRDRRPYDLADMTAHLDSGLFDEADIAEVEELAAEYYDALDRAEEPSDDEVPA